DAVGFFVRHKTDAGRCLDEIARTYPRSEPPCQLLVAADRLVLDEVEIKSVPRFAQLQVLKVRPVEIRLKLDVGSFARLVPPARHDIAAGNKSVVVRYEFRRRCERGDHHALPAYAAIQVSLHRKRVAIAGLPIGAEAHLPHPPVVEAVVIGMELGSIDETHAVDPVVEILAHRAAIARGSSSLIHAAAAQPGQHPFGLVCALGDDVDYAVYGI